MPDPIRVLHFADVHIGMENYGRTDPRSGLSSRVVDFLRRMDEMIAYASEHDFKIAQKISWVLCGGDLTSESKVTEQYLLDLEREAFLSLCGEKKTLERIQSILTTGKPLRN